MRLSAGVLNRFILYFVLDFYRVSRRYSIDEKWGELLMPEFARRKVIDEQDEEWIFAVYVRESDTFSVSLFDEDDEEAGEAMMNLAGLGYSQLKV